MGRGQRKKIERHERERGEGLRNKTQVQKNSRQRLYKSEKTED
jgi:hypothetical protein